MDFDWQKFQKHLGYNDRQLAEFKADPRKAEAAQKLFSPQIAQKYLIIEVVDSHGCTVGMKIGDRLVFKALGVLLPAKSSQWCSQAMAEIGGFANMAQDRFVSGLDPNGMIFNHFSCMDAGAKCGWGQVVMKAYVVDEADLPA